MASVNKVMLLGRITRDIELRYLAGGTAVTDVGLVVDHRYKDKQGDWVEKPCFLDVTMWGRTAEVAGEYLGKGSQVHIEGRLDLDQWEDKETGKKRSKVKVVCERMTMVGSGRGGGGKNQDSEYSEAIAKDGAGGREPGEDDPDSEVPF